MNPIEPVKPVKPIEPHLNSNHTAAEMNPVSAGRGRSIGAILVDSRRLSTDNAERILLLQKEKGMRFGDAAIELGLLTEDDIRFALSSQFDYRYLPANNTKLSHTLVAAYKPFSAVAEQMRALRSQLMLRWFDAEAQRKALAIISPGNSEGRSFIAANLAVVFSQLGERTLLIDADLRNPCQHKLFKLDNAHGLSGMLAGRNGMEAVVRIPSLAGLSVLPSGVVPPNPQELLGRSAFTDVLSTLAQDFDIILFDTPAASHFADAQTVASRAGAAIMLARKNQSSLTEMAVLTSDLQHAGTALVGSVLNEV